MYEHAYRLSVIKSLTTGAFRLIISDDTANETIATAKSATNPKIAQVRAWLARYGFEAYGDMRQVGDRTLTSMIRKVA